MAVKDVEENILYTKFSASQVDLPELHSCFSFTLQKTIFRTNIPITSRVLALKTLN